MNNIKKEIQAHLQLMNGFTNFEAFTGKNLVEWIEPLINSLTDDGAISYLMGSKNKERYRASPLASTLIWMNEVRLLPDNVVSIMQDKLLYLRDHCESEDKDKGNVEKKQEDTEGWSMSEGVSVWSTSLALIALMNNTQIGVAKGKLYKSSIIWLAKQQKHGEKGWAYQLSANCSENAVMTSLALRAIALALKYDSYFQFSEDEKHVLYSSLMNGYEYLKENIHYNKRKTEAYWCFENRKHCAATVWALIALKEMQELNVRLEIATFFKNNVMLGIDFVLSCMPKKVTRWEDEQVVCEAGAKYNKQKNYYSFSPTLILELLKIGVSPYHYKVINQIKWLLNNQNEWKIQQYDRSEVCSFTYAMLISTITKWSIMVGQENTVRILRNVKGRADRVLQIVMGIPLFEESCVQVVNKARLKLAWAISLFIIFLALKGKDIFEYISSGVNDILLFFGQEQNTIFTNIISSALYALIILIVAKLLGFVGKLLRRLKH